MSFKLSAEAEEDIIAIAEQGVRMFGADQAKRYHDELFALFDLIAVNPRIARKRDEIDPPVRIHPFKAHLIVYRIENDETIFVIRIRHAHEDWARDSI
ncbi:type II toxin-antitoxin system RelE/ParE family toxin [Rhizobium laguerreae]|uniref:type II toxin-antitoxin system RelE/ParE family toxin n=1 Tax=Rhizobium laguerreae TaxID=1076926 RepID=UPI001C916672|nr:type II toxin-antitoxin system RelE/ParE family toxin [Rhizobium laguerreae]MBY3087705.1 type II toxin-antitoxin system RelE/ParE family toxin [Rhizobium laguerreae]MBY3148543.1 type II toxin-antitoxin system RelE/ParE family toxin [Rhizobium laguerreae]